LLYNEIMNKQFISEKIKKDIFQINEPWNREGCNIFLFKKDNSCLIFDVGLGLFSIKKFINKLKIDNFLVALTHSHFDHIGGIADFMAEEFIVPKVIVNAMQNRSGWALEYLKAENFDESKLVNLVDKTAQQICNDFIIQIPDMIPIKKNIINWFDYCFEVIHLGGHSNDSCVYYDHAHKILVSGDLLYNGEIYTNCYSSDKKSFAKALNIISQLDFEIVLSGHNKIMNRKKALFVVQKWLSDLS